MLKNLLQTWIEAVFGAKKEWISSQAFPATVSRTNIPLGTPQYLPPSDGFIGVYTNDVADVYQLIENTISTRIVVESKSGISVGSTVPVVKGAIVNISGSGLQELWFIPTAGSQ